MQTGRSFRFSFERGRLRVDPWNGRFIDAAARGPGQCADWSPARSVNDTNFHVGNADVEVINGMVDLD